MLGPPKPRRLDQPIAVSLEELVPQNHFYRHLEGKLDLGFVREWVQERYADRGRPSIDLVVFFKLQLVMFFEGLRSERKLVEAASLNLAHRWYLGYALDELLPDHSSLTRIRQRLGVEVFERFFEKVVDLCQEGGLVWGKGLFFDATKIRADAAVTSLVPRFSHEAQPISPTSARTARQRRRRWKLRRLMLALRRRTSCVASRCRSSQGSDPGTSWRSAGWTPTALRQAATSAPRTSG